MHKQVAIALAAPVFDPERQITQQFFWMAERTISAGLTCNIGMERSRYAGGRPLWQLSLVWREPNGRPVPVLRWSPTKWRKAEAVRDAIMRGVGTDEPWVVEDMSKQFGERAIAVHYRRPLRIDEVARMAPTPEVRAREGRP